MEGAPKKEKPKFTVITGGKVNIENKEGENREGGAEEDVDADLLVQEEVRAMADDPDSDTFIFNTEDKED